MRRAIVVALTAMLGGCILLIDPIETTDHCGIQGTSDCAACLRTSCQTPIDRCCASSECSSGKMLGAMDACGRGENASCADILASPRIQKDEEALRSCASSACGARCRQGSTGTGADNRPKWTCSTSRDQNNVCSSCLYQKCSAKVDSCCDDSSCITDPTIQIDMAACVAGDVRGCAYLLDNERSKSGQAGVLRKCIADNCNTQCMGDGRPHTKCEVHAGGDYCDCSNAEVSSGPTCNREVVNGNCVLGTEGCTCGQYTCTDDNSGGCGCTFFGATVVGTSCTAPSGKVCCAKRDLYSVKCECRYSSCSTSLGEQEIASCNIDDLLPWAGQVDACSR